jgi:DNA-binding transcriptional LysR family regulator
MKRLKRSSLHSTGYLYFEAVARLGSIRKAADELFVVPSAVSHQISQLESELGVPLFKRLPRGLQLSSAGEMLLYHARRAASELERGRNFLQNLSDLRSGSTSLATVEGAAIGPVSEALAAFWKRWPKVRVNLSLGSTARAFDVVDRGEAELGLAYVTAESPRVKVLETAELKLGAIFRSDHPFAKRAKLTLRELMEAGLPLLLPDHSIGVRVMLEHALGKDALRLLPRVETNSALMMCRLAAAGAGVAVKTRIGIETELKDGTLAFVPLRDLALQTEQLALFCRDDSPLPPAGAALAEALGKVLKGLHGR